MEEPATTRPAAIRHGHGGDHLFATPVIRGVLASCRTPTGCMIASGPTRPCGNPCVEMGLQSRVLFAAFDADETAAGVRFVRELVLFDE